MGLAGVFPILAESSLQWQCTVPVREVSHVFQDNQSHFIPSKLASHWCSWWPMSHKNRSYNLCCCHTKKEGLAGTSPFDPSFGMTGTIKYCLMPGNQGLQQNMSPHHPDHDTPTLQTVSALHTGLLVSTCDAKCRHGMGLARHKIQFYSWCHTKRLGWCQTSLLLVWHQQMTRVTKNGP